MTPEVVIPELAVLIQNKIISPETCFLNIILIHFN